MNVATRFLLLMALLTFTIIPSGMVYAEGEILPAPGLYDPATELYSRVVAGVDGDFAVMNLAPEAEDLLAELADLAGTTRSCEFRGATCQGADCDSDPPDCGRRTSCWKFRGS